MFFDEIKSLFKGIKLKDFLFFLSVPILISIIHLFDYFFNISNYLVLNINNPSFWQFFTSSFVHLSSSHFFNNLNSILIIGVILLIISTKIDKNKEFLKFFFLITLILPFLISFFHVIFNPFNVEIMAGSSGLLSAYLGLIPLFWGRLFLKSNKNMYKLILSMLFYVLFVFVFRYHSVRFSLFFLLMFFIFLIYLNFNEIDFKKYNSLKYLYKMLFLFPILFFLISIHVYVFPLDLIIDGNIVEYFSHFIGILLGIIISLISLYIN